VSGQQQLLNDSQIADFLSRHPTTALQVAATETAIATVGYDQINSPPSWYEFDVNLGLIPTWGVSVNDSVYGNVIIFPGADGTMYYNGFVPAGIDTTVNNPAFVSPNATPPGTELPPCDPTTNDLSGWLCSLQGTAKTALTLIGLFLLYELTR